MLLRLTGSAGPLPCSVSSTIERSAATHACQADRHSHVNIMMGRRVLSLPSS